MWLPKPRICFLHTPLPPPDPPLYREEALRSKQMGSSSDGDRPWQSYHTVYTNAKAGMDGVDKEKVQRIVYEMSKGSKYFENEQRKDAYIKQKIDSLHSQCAKLTEKEISHFQKCADRRIMELEAERDLSKVWLHCDMDAFYAAVETLLDPSLKGNPLAVGSMSMICTANYEARKYGVRAAMPGFIARKLCPELIFIPTNFEKYTYYSELTRRVFRKYDPNFIATSLDEAYLNITNICTERAISGIDVAEELRSDVNKETGLTCSVGVAPNRLLAKVCSDINKPNGWYSLPNDQRAIMAFISSLPIRKIGGIGKVTEHLLREALGINNCEEMLQKRALICALFSRCSYDFFLSAALGIGETETPQLRSRKSISCERTFPATNDPVVLFQKLEELAESLWSDTQQECLQGRTLTLKLKTASFEVRTRAASIQRYFHSKQDLLSHAIKLLKAELPLYLRLLGLRISQFEDKSTSTDPSQKTLINFVLPGDTSRIVMSANHSECSDVDNDSMLDTDINSTDVSNICFSSAMKCTSMQCHQNDLVDHIHTSDSCMDLGVRNTDVKEPDMVTDVEKINETASSFATENVLSDRREQLIWLDDYICSVCGIELPPSFTEERQEHSDYHMAEILQEEENMAYPLKTSRNRSVLREKAQKAERSHKKSKHSPCSNKFLPIDSFFVRIRKNE